MSRNDATDIILGIVQELKSDIKEIKIKQSQIIEDMALFHELHVNCPGKQAKKILDEKGMKTVIFFTIHPKIFIATIVGFLVISFSSMALAGVKLSKEIQEVKEKVEQTMRK
jgi:archaellum component FlaC